MAIGRPTRYNEEMQEKADDYVDNFAKYGDVIPSIAGLSLVLNITRSTVYEWGKREEYSEFSDTLAKLSAMQENRLLNNGLNGEFNAAITKLALCNHGYSDKVEDKPKDNEEKTKYVIITDANRD